MARRKRPPKAAAAPVTTTSAGAPPPSPPKPVNEGATVVSTVPPKPHRDLYIGTPQVLPPGRGMAPRRMASLRERVAAFCGPGTGSFGGGGVGGGFGNMGGTVADSAGGSFYSPELSTDFLQLPQSLVEQWNYYRFFYYNEPFVGRAIDTHVQLPLSKVRLARPVAKNKDMAEEALRFCKKWVRRVELSERLAEIVFNYFLIGEVFVFVEDANPDMPRTIRQHKVSKVDEEGGVEEVWEDREDADEQAAAWMRKNYKGWTGIRVLPPEQVHIETFPFTDKALIEVIPDSKTKHLVDMAEAGDANAMAVVESMDPSVIAAVREQRNISLNTDPMDGSFVHYMANKPAGYEPRGHSILQRCLLPGTLMTVCRNDVIQEVQVEDVDVETDLLLTHTGHFRKAQKGSRLVSEPVTILTIEGVEKPLRLTSDHEVMVMGEDGSERWVEAGKLCPGDTVRGAHVVPEREPVREIDLAAWWKDRVLTGAKRARPNRKGAGRSAREVRVIESEVVGGELVVTFEYDQDDAARVDATEEMRKFLGWLTSLEGPTEATTQTVADLLDIPRTKLRNYVCLFQKERGLKTERKHLFGQGRGAITTVFHPLPKGTTVPGESVYYTLSSKIPKIVVSEDFCYVLGTWLGDGCVWNTQDQFLGVNSLEWCSGLSETGRQIMAKVRSCIQNLWGDVTTEGSIHSRALKDIRTENIHIADTLLTYWFKDQFGHTSQGKRLPSWIFDLDIKCLKSFLCGVVDTDGNIDYQEKNVSTGLKIELDNQILVSQLHFLMSMVGVSSSVRTANRKSGSWTRTWATRNGPKTETYQYQDKTFPVLLASRRNEIKILVEGSVKGKNLQIRESSHFNATKNRFKNGWLTSKIKEVDQVEYSGPVFSFDVEGDHSHVSNFIVTHNCIRVLTHLDILRQAVRMITARHMTPVRLVWAENMNEQQVEELRCQIDMALQDPDFSIITNFQVTWEELNSNGRLLELSGEYDLGHRQLYAGLGVTESLLSGESTYAGDRINLEVLNTRYMALRDKVQNLVEKQFLEPMCRQMGFVEEDEDGDEVVVFPRFSFTRLALRDHQEIFDALFQLYQKGSLDIDTIYEVLNLDPETVTERLKRDVGTLKDASFNDLLRGLYPAIGTALAENSDFVQKIAEYLGVKYTPPAPEGESRF